MYTYSDTSGHEVHNMYKSLKFKVLGINKNPIYQSFLKNSSDKQ